MAGGENVLANLTRYEVSVKEGLPGALRRHFEGSREFVYNNYPWEMDTGLALRGILIDVGHDGSVIEGGIGQGADRRKWLELRESFHGKYKILERARNNNLAKLWAECRAIVAGQAWAHSLHMGESNAGDYSGWKY